MGPVVLEGFGRVKIKPTFLVTGLGQPLVTIRKVVLVEVKLGHL
jgi:hypothetical protein